LTCLGQVERKIGAEGLDPDFLEDLSARFEDRLVDDGLESYLPWLGPSATVIDYLPDTTRVFWLDPPRLQ
jgi:hypothetical protein